MAGVTAVLSNVKVTSSPELLEVIPVPPKSLSLSVAKDTTLSAAPSD